MADLNQEIKAYASMEKELENTNMGKWVVVHECKLAGMYESFEKAAEDAVGKFGRGPYLIKQVGAPPVVLPASVMYRPVHG